MATLITPDIKLRSAYAFTSAKDERLQTVLARLDGFGRLRAGWYSGQGKHITQQLLNEARKLLLAAFNRGMDRFDVFPGKGGQVTVVVYVGNVDHSFQIQPNSTVKYWDEADAISDEETLSLPAAYTKICQLPLLWNLSISFISDIGIQKKAVSEARDLSHQTTAVFQWHAINAYLMSADVFVSTEDDSTKVSVPSHRSFGSSTQGYCLVTAA